MDNSVNFYASHLQYCAERLPSGKFILLGQLFKWYSIAVDKGQRSICAYLVVRSTQYSTRGTAGHTDSTDKGSVDLVDLYNVRFFCKNALPLEFRQRNFGQFVATFYVLSILCVSRMIHMTFHK